MARGSRRSASTLLDDRSPLFSLHDELRSLAKGPGMTVAKLLVCPTILGLPAVTDEGGGDGDRATAARSVIVCAIFRLGSPIRRAYLFQMLNVDGKPGNLTARRQDFVVEKGIGKDPQRELEADAYLELAGDLLIAETSPCRAVPDSNALQEKAAS